jgi:plastocyanin
VNKYLTILAVLAMAVVSAGEGTLTGMVKYDGDAPKPKMINIAPDKAAGCPHGERADESLVVDPATKGIMWAVIRIMDVKAGDPPAADAKIDQGGCKFTPRVVVVAPGSNLDVLNPDKLPHNVHTIPLDGTNIPINRMMTPNDEKLTVKGSKHLAEAELIQIQCDIHPWMKGFVVVHDPRFAAVTGADGKFEIKGIPPGKYKVMINHDLGEQEKEIEIKEGANDLGEILFKQK